MYSNEHSYGLRRHLISLANFLNSGQVYNLSPERVEKDQLSKAE